MKIPPPYFSPLLPTIITGPGRYFTRCGEVVTVLSVTGKSLYSCIGAYANGTRESWHKSGRIFPATDTTNDIIGTAP